MTNQCVVYIDSDSQREEFLNELETKGDLLKKVKVDRAKTAFQMGRNGALVDAERVLKKNFPGKKVEIVWMNKQDKKDKSRSVNVDGVPAFKQVVDESHGVFSSDFRNLSK